ncbi:uncharacterized protein LOC134723614 [Mytilus trossulus]|uniref:uncharacterized protein LOC134723614 n=1 Tax=Mytilus trossulus TaxID=6551 RepID=UPI00300422D8
MMGTNKVGETSRSLEDPSKTEDPKKKSIRQRDVLAAMLVGYIVGILLMMIIHFIIQNKCTENCTTSSVGSSNELQDTCFEGWIILAGEKTCFFQSYFDVNWTVVEPEAGTSEVDEYFQKIGTIQDINDDILVGTVFNNDRGFYQWIGGSGSNNILPGADNTVASPNATSSCVSDLQEAPTEWGLNLLAAKSNDTCFIL